MRRFETFGDRIFFTACRPNHPLLIMMYITADRFRLFNDESATVVTKNPDEDPSAILQLRDCR